MQELGASQDVLRYAVELPAMDREHAPPVPDVLTFEKRRPEPDLHMALVDVARELGAPPSLPGTVAKRRLDRRTFRLAGTP